MGLFCDHNWESRSGMDSGSRCTECGDLSDREVARNADGSRSNKLEPLMNSFKKMSLFCSHKWESRSGMDSGSVCTNCGELSDKELHRSSNHSTPDNKKIDFFNSNSKTESAPTDEETTKKRRKLYY